jgi:hypothetical protein
MSRKRLFFLVLSVVAMTLTFVMFKLRYGWYIGDNQAIFLNSGFATGGALIIFLWFVFPSRVATAALGAAIFLFPPLLRPDFFVPLDVAFGLYASIPLSLLVIAAHLRLRDGR